MKDSFVLIASLFAVALMGCGDVAGTSPDPMETGTEPGPSGEPKSTFPCTEQGIREAVSQGGGPLRFACDGPTTVVTSDEIAIERDVILDGSGELTVDADGRHRVFSVGAGAGAEFRGLAVTGGFVDSTAERPYGGGVLNEGGLVLRDSVIRFNEAPAGGGLQSSGVLTLIRSAVVANEADSGGGVASSGWLIVRDSHVTANEARTGHGGGILAESGISFLINASVSENRAPLGAGIFNWGRMSLDASTVSENRVQEPNEDLGGGIFHERGTLSLKDTLVSANAGGGICNCRTDDGGGGGTLTVTSGGIASNEARGIVNLSTAYLMETTVIGNTVGGISNEGMLNVTGSELYGGIHALCEASEVHFHQSRIHEACTGAAATIVSHGSNVEMYGDTCGLDHETDDVNISVPG